jgi:hypothetical protein
VRLHWRLAAALLATYLRADLALADRVTVYARVINYCARRSRDPRQAARVIVLARGRGVFQQDLDRARWCLRYALLQPVLLQAALQRP